MKQELNIKLNKYVPFNHAYNFSTPTLICKTKVCEMKGDVADHMRKRFSILLDSCHRTSWSFHEITHRQGGYGSGYIIIPKSDSKPLCVEYTNCIHYWNWISLPSGWSIFCDKIFNVLKTNELFHVLGL
jgi:hypothetical protein